MSGCARDATFGNDGSVWIIGCEPILGGYPIYKLNRETLQWDRIPGSAVRIQALNEVTSLFINDQNRAFKTAFKAVPVFGR